MHAPFSRKYVSRKEVNSELINSVTDEKARMRMVSSFDLENTKPDWALCYRFDIVLRGRNATPLDND